MKLCNLVILALLLLAGATGGCQYCAYRQNHKE